MILHGINGSSEQFTQFVADLEEAHPGTLAIALPLFNDLKSIVSLGVQVPEIAAKIISLTSSDPAYADGYHLVCHSQGALICRCLTSYMDTHNVDTLVSMAGPQLGVYDDAFFSFFERPILQELTLEDIYKVAYTDVAQKTVSVANMWSDPYHRSEHLSSNDFLPLFNNEVTPNESYKNNFLSLRKAVFTVGSQAGGETYDGGIGPWQSAVFSYYNETGAFVDMKEQEVYKSDTFGLKTMDERGDLTTLVVEGVEHQEWVNNKGVYTKYIFPWLV